MHIELMVDGSVTDWANNYGLTYPVISDSSQAVAGDYIIAEGGSYGLPNYSVLDRTMVMQAKYTDHTSAMTLVEQLLADPLPDVEWPLPEDPPTDDDDDAVDEGGDPDPSSVSNPFGVVQPWSTEAGCSVSPAESTGPSSALSLAALALLISLRRTRRP